MTAQRIDFANTAAGKVIAAFLMEKGQPTTDDWKQLIAEYPEYAGEIADAALLRQCTRHLEENDVSGPLKKAAYEATVSQAVNLLHTIPSAELSRLETKVAAVRGAAVRKLATEVGLGSNAALLSGVLAGTIVVPSELLERLTAVFNTSVFALTEFLRRSSESSEVPAFKVEQGKPQVAAKPTPWVDAVQSLNLSEEQAKELLSLED